MWRREKGEEARRERKGEGGKRLWEWRKKDKDEKGEKSPYC